MKIIGSCMYDWTCSSSPKPPAIAVHVLVQTPMPASRLLVQGMSVVNKSENMPLIYNEVLYLLLPKQGTKSKVFFPNPWIGEQQLDQGCISQMFILRLFSSENGSLVSLTGNNFLSTILSNWSYTFCWADNTSNIGKTANKVFRSHNVRHISFYP